MSGIGKARALVAVLAVAFVVVPASAHADADTTPPELQDLSVPADIVADEDGANLAVSATIVDDGSGVASSNTCAGGGAGASTIHVESPSGYGVVAAFSALGADRFAGTVHLPNYAQAGTWRIAGVELVDCAGNADFVDTAELQAAKLPIRFVVRGMDDTQPPVATSVAVAPATVDNASGETTVAVTATITDNRSGVADDTADCGEFQGDRIAVLFRSPSGRDSADSAFRRRAGNVFEGTLTVRRFAEVGTWSIELLYLIDCARNSLLLLAPDLQARGLSASFQVTGVDDTTAPALSYLAIDPQTVDTRAAGADVSFKAELTDEGTGVATSDTKCSGAASVVELRSPAGEYHYAPFAPVGGDVYVATLRLPRFAEPGTWTVTAKLLDCALNYREVGPAALAALGLQSTFEVLPPVYAFGGFKAPLDASALAQRTAGSAMAVKFTLGGAQGTDVFDEGFPQVQPVDCDTRAPLGDAVSLGPTEWVFQDLTDGLYHFKWKSSHDWHNVCRRLVLGFDDGSRYSADVRFK